MEQSIPFIFLTALIVENMMFTRGFGSSQLLRRIHGYKSILQFGVMSLFLSVVTASVSWLLLSGIDDNKLYSRFRPLVVILVLVVCYYGITFAVHKLLKGKKWSLSSLLLSSTFNSGVYGGVLLSLTYYRGDFLRALVYSCGVSLGLVLAMVLIHAGRERLSIAKVPKAFSGLPIMLLYIGIISLAIYGLIGRQLPN